MDFVVAGFGLGSLAVLAGILLADRGAFWRPGRDPAALARSARARGFGRVLAVGGGVLIALTAIGLLLPGGDRAGTILVAVGAAGLAVAVAAWTLGAFGRAPAGGHGAPAASPRPQRPIRPAAAARPAGARPSPPPRLADLPDPDEPDWPDAGDPLAWHDDPLFAPARPGPATRRTAGVAALDDLSWPDDLGLDPIPPAQSVDDPLPPPRPRPRTS